MFTVLNLVNGRGGDLTDSMLAQKVNGYDHESFLTRELFAAEDLFSRVFLLRLRLPWETVWCPLW